MGTWRLAYLQLFKPLSMFMADDAFIVSVIAGGIGVPMGPMSVGLLSSVPFAASRPKPLEGASSMPTSKRLEQPSSMCLSKVSAMQALGSRTIGLTCGVYLCGQTV